jgi:acyl-CoA synthetase (AMP-forming)/AMP-acid ligase II
LLHHEGLAVFALTQNQIWPVRKYVGLNYFPINHVGSVADCTLPAIVAGGTLHFLEQFDPSDALALMVKEGVSIWGSVPSTFPMIMDLPEFDPAALSAAELIAWGGAPMPEPVIERLLRVNRSLATNYGMTESTSAITAVSPTDDVELLANSVGIAFPGVEVRLLNSSGVPVAAGAVGEVQARSRMNFLGYWNRPEATRAAFTEDGWLRTGDLAIRREDGRYRIVGRIREMYKSGGYNVYPREVEQAIEDHPAIEVAAVVGVFSPVWHEVGAAFVVLREPLTEAELMAWLRLRLANYKLPKLVYFESGLPLLPIGKIDKEALRKRAQEDGAAGGAGNRRS